MKISDLTPQNTEKTPGGYFPDAEKIFVRYSEVPYEEHTKFAKLLDELNKYAEKSGLIISENVEKSG